MVRALKIAGLDRGEWILTAYLGSVAASSVVPPALVLVEVLPQPGGSRAIALTCAASVLAGLGAYFLHVLLLPIRVAASGRVARWLAIPIVSRWLMHGTDLRRLLRRQGSSFLTAATRRTLDDVTARSVLAERIHAAGFAAGLPWVVVANRFEAPGLAAFVAGVTLLFQFYPILVQRETRRRVTRLTRRR